MWKKALVLLMALAMTLSVSSFSFAEGETRVKVLASDGKTEFYATGLPIVDPEQNVEIEIWGVTSAADPNNFAMVKKWIADTGINIRIVGVSKDGLEERKNLMWASNDYPDILGPEVPTETDIELYGSMGIILPLNAYIDKYLTNTRTYLTQEEWDNIWSTLTYPDGNIYTYPTVTDYYYCDSTVPSINVTWLEQLGMAVPETPDEFVEYLRAVKNTDLNGNGRADEIPLCIQGWEDVYELYALAGWTGDLGGFKYIKDGAVYYPIATDAVREAAIWLNQLYREGLMDPEIFTQDENMFKGKGQGTDLVYGFSTVWREGNAFGEANGINYFPMRPLKGANGERMWYGTQNKNLIMTQWCVTAGCQTPEIVARLIDYLYTPINSLQNNYGPIGVCYEPVGNGQYKSIVPAGFSTFGEYFVDNHFQQVPRMMIGEYLRMNDGLGILWEDEITRSWSNCTERYIAGLAGTSQKQVHDMILGEFIFDDFPDIKSNQEEIEALNMLLPDFEKYVMESFTRFITGEMSIEKDWDEFAARVNALGYEEILAIYQGQYDRYMGNAM